MAEKTNTARFYLGLILQDVMDAALNKKKKKRIRKSSGNILFDLDIHGRIRTKTIVLDDLVFSSLQKRYVFMTSLPINNTELLVLNRFDLCMKTRVANSGFYNITDPKFVLKTTSALASTTLLMRCVLTTWANSGFYNITDPMCFSNLGEFWLLQHY